MAKDYRPVERDQGFLIPPDIREWLDPGHVAWFVLEAVAAMDTSSFHRARPGRVNAASAAGKRGYDPDLLVGLLIYAYAVGERSSRRIEKLCWTDVAFRVLCANDIPDHTVIARFRRNHEAAFEDLFTQVLVLCAKAQLGSFGRVALDGTKIAANASIDATRSESTLRSMAREMIDEAYAADRADERAARRGDDSPTPPGLRTHAARKATIEAALAQIDAERAADAAKDGPTSISAKKQRAERTEAKYERAVAHHEEVTARWQARVDSGDRYPGPKPVPTSDNVTVQKARKVAERARRSYERATTSSADGGTGRTYRANLTDPHSRLMNSRTGFLQGYNAQLVVSDDHLIIAATVTADPTDTGAYVPMIDRATATIDRVWGAGTGIGTVLADAGYFSRANLTAPGPDRLIAPGNHRNLTEPTTETAEQQHDREHDDPLVAMRARIATPDGHATYKRRGALVEPINGHLKDRRGLRRFARRGLAAVNGELHLAAAVTNLARLFTATATA